MRPNLQTAVKYFDKTLGRSKRFSGELKLISERVTARELICRRIEQEFRNFNPDNDKASWLIVPESKEKTLNGPRSYGLSWQYDETLLDRNLSVAIQAFEAQSFLLFVDNQQLDTLDECVTLRNNSTLTFVKLVPLVGG